MPIQSPSGSGSGIIIDVTFGCVIIGAF